MVAQHTIRRTYRRLSDRAQPHACTEVSPYYFNPHQPQPREAGHKHHRITKTTQNAWLTNANAPAMGLVSPASVFKSLQAGETRFDAVANQQHQPTRPPGNQRRATASPSSRSRRHHMMMSPKNQQNSQNLALYYSDQKRLLSAIDNISDRRQKVRATRPQKPQVRRKRAATRMSEKVILPPISAVKSVNNKSAIAFSFSAKDIQRSYTNQIQKLEKKLHAKHKGTEADLLIALHRGIEQVKDSYCRSTDVPWLSPIVRPTRPRLFLDPWSQFQRYPLE